VAYYRGVLENEAAKRGEGLWAAPSLSHPFDVMMVAAGVVLLLSALRLRLPLWEYVALLGLAVGTAMAARHGIWLLMAASAPAAAALSSRRDRPVPPVVPAGSGALRMLLAVALGGAVVLTRGDSVLPADPDVVEAVADVAGDQVVLAPEPLAESLALEGVQVWAADPIDAFDQRTQAAYLDFLDGEGKAGLAVAESDLVVVEKGSDAADLMAQAPGLRVSQLPGDYELYTRE
jgi:hypothetical protein